MSVVKFQFVNYCIAELCFSIMSCISKEFLLRRSQGGGMGVLDNFSEKGDIPFVLEIKVDRKSYFDAFLGCLPVFLVTPMNGDC